MRLPITPPIEPMLARPADAIPSDDGWLFEPKWDGFRAIVFRDGDEVLIQSRDLKPLDRYFPELAAPLRERLPSRCVLDGEVVIAGDSGLDFEALLLRIHPAASRVAMLAERSPASFVAWDLLALDDEDLSGRPQEARRTRLESVLGSDGSRVHLTPLTRDRAQAQDWFERFEGAGLDGVVAKRADAPYQPGKRAMVKIKHQRTADCVVAGFRWHKLGEPVVGSLLLGLYDDAGVLHHVGVTSSFTMERRRQLADELAPLRKDALEGHPWAGWADWAEEMAASGRRVPGAQSRWNQGRDLSWEALRAERVVEVAYDHLQGDRFRHGTTFRRWRPDKRPEDCRYDQLESTPPYELGLILGGEHR
jgi:ATP-dependent DNA ligase